MPQQPSFSVENNFTKGLVTDSTGLNFPENAATDCDNCEFTLVGDVLRREGIDIEDNGTLNTLADRTGKAVSTYKWNNAGGDGLTQLVVTQIGSILYFWAATSATTASPLSAQKLSGTIDISSFTVSGGSFDATTEVQYADGNGYLFVFHPSCEPFYVTYSSGTFTTNSINLQIRDFTGVVDGYSGSSVSTRPSVLSNDHKYNLQNQGWTSGSAWTFISTSNSPLIAVGSITFQGTSDLVGVTNGQVVSIATANNGDGHTVPGTVVGSGTVTSYSGTSLTINVTSYTGRPAVPGQLYVITPISTGYLTTWNTAEGNYPSNADVWWYFKDSTGAFAPATTASNISLSTGNAPRGHYLLSAFNQDRASISGITGITPITTLRRPSTGTWFQGRVWFSGVNATFTATGDAQFYNWSETIYFSQIVTSDTSQFGNCYQTNDPTSETLFDILPTDGGTIVIQGSGAIYKLFPVQNGLLVFASNGVWFITGSQGIGFSAVDYTIVKLSAVEAISAYSFVNVQGLPYFWNEEAVYQVQANQTGQLSVVPLTVGVIQSFYDAIPKQSKQYARGVYDPINFTIQWIYKETQEASVTDRYAYDSILNFNVYNKSFFPYSIDNTIASINGINYIQGPGGSTSPDPTIKFFCSSSTTRFSFAEEYDETYVDWATVSPVNYTSYFVTGYKLRGQAIRKFQPLYVQVYSRTDGVDGAYKIQGVWDYATNANSGRWSNAQLTYVPHENYGTFFRRHKIRGHGYSLQLKISSEDGSPFDIQGWAIADTINTGT